MVDHNDEFGSSAPPLEAASEYPNYGEPNPGGAVGEPSSPLGESLEGLLRRNGPLQTSPWVPVDDTPGHPSSRWCWVG